MRQCFGRRGRPDVTIPDYCVSDNYVSEPWYFGKTKRFDAEKQLLLPENDGRTFLIRESISQPYSLSVRQDRKVKHYKIQKDACGYFIVHRTTFKTLQELVNYYMEVAAIKPCVQVKKAVHSGYIPQSQVIQWQFVSSQIKKARNLRPGTFGFKTLKTNTMEKKIMKIHTHAILIQLYAICTMKMPIYIISEFMKNGSLFDFLQGKGLSLKLQQSMYISVQKGSGIYNLEYNNYIHHTLVSRYDHIEKNSIVKIKYYCNYLDISGTITIIYDFILYMNLTFFI